MVDRVLSKLISLVRVSAIVIFILAFILMVVGSKNVFIAFDASDEILGISIGAWLGISVITFFLLVIVGVVAEVIQRLHKRFEK